MSDLSRRGRGVTVLLFVLAGGLGIISSTQTWLHVTRVDGGQDILVAGAQALPLLAPLSLTALALAGAIALVGRVPRTILAGLAVAIGAVLGMMTLTVAIQLPLSAVSAAVTEVTGLAGQEAVDDVVSSVTATAWPWLTLLACVCLVVAGAFAAATAHLWKSGGRRFQANTAKQHDGPIDSVESWDDLSHGTDPTR